MRVVFACLLVLSCAACSDRSTVSGVRLDLSAVRSSLAYQMFDMREFTLNVVCISIDTKCIDSPETCGVTQTFAIKGTLDDKGVGYVEAPACGTALLGLVLTRTLPEGEPVAALGGTAEATLDSGPQDIEFDTRRVGEIEVTNATASERLCSFTDPDLDIAIALPPVPAGRTQHLVLPEGTVPLRCTDSAGGNSSEQTVTIEFAQRKNAPLP